MSSPSPIADSGRFPAVGQKVVFSHTCNLLSQYVKEKRTNISGTTSFADGYGANYINNNNNNNNRGTMNLFPGKHVEENSYPCIGQSVNLFPQSSVFNNSALPYPGLGKRESPEPPAGQMTIFYGGQVMVFNDLTADKAKEIMDLASCFESNIKRRKVDAPANPTPNLNPNHNPNPNPNPNPNLNPNLYRQNLTLSPAVIAASFGTPLSMVPVGAASTRPFLANASDLPIARKASLHRFLEKRKDRIIGKIPDISSEVVSKPMEGNPWLGLGSLPVYQAQQQF